MASPHQQQDVEIDQAGAGTTVLVAGVTGLEIHVLNYFVVISAAGTVAFSDGTDWKTGDIPLDAKSGLAERGDLQSPLFVCGRDRPLQITTTGGSAHGRARIEWR